MMFKRKIYDSLLEWKNEKHKTALLIEGARRIGKSTIVEEFGKREYKSYILIDFNDVSDEVLNAFHRHLNDLDTFFMILSVEFGVQLFRGESLIIFDEVQQFPKARQTLKKLVADGRYDYIETGSLISIRENVKGITLPSEERSIRMYPLDFEEFCWALDKKMMIDYIKQCYESFTPLEQGLHANAMLLFRQYMLVGGMPQSVSMFLEYDRSFIESDKVKRDILKLYKNDINKIDGNYKAKVLSIYEQIPSFLSMHEKRVRLSNIQSNSTYPMYEETFYWLSDSMIANECFNCNDPNVGLALNEDRTLVKCYLGDTGLLFSQTFSEKEIEENELYKEILRGKLSINQGMFFENVIAQTLVSKGYPLFFYTRYDEKKNKNDIEIDFLISNRSKTRLKIFPIEVKSSKNYTTISLEKFKKSFKQRIGNSYVIHTKNLQIKENGIICIPAYMAFCL